LSYRGDAVKKKGSGLAADRAFAGLIPLRGVRSMLLRRLLAGLFALALLLPLCGMGLYGQEKDKDKKKEEAKKEEGKKDEPKEKVSLKWKFEKGKTFYQKLTTKTDQTMTVNNNKVTQVQDQTFYFSWTVDKVEGDTVVLTQKILGVVMNIDIGGSKISYDSTAAAAPGGGGTTNPLSEFFKQLVGAEFKVTLDTKNLKVTKIEGRDDFLKKLVAANAQMKPLLDTILSEKALVEMAEPTFAVIPTDAKAKGESWTRNTTLDMGPIGKYDNKYTYTYDGKEGKLDKIKVTAELTYQPPTGDTAGVGGLPFKIKDAKLKSGDSSGAVYFDEAKGRVDRSNLSLTLKGELSIEIGGQTTKVDLDQKQTTEVTSSDEDPLAKKKP
jgi:hypothetical protein